MPRQSNGALRAARERDQRARNAMPTTRRTAATRYFALRDPGSEVIGTRLGLTRDGRVLDVIEDEYTPTRRDRRIARVAAEG